MTIEIKINTCAGPKCTREGSKTQGLCHAHTQQLKRNGKLTPLQNRPRAATRVCDQECSFPSCKSFVLAKNLCSGHYNQLKLKGKLSPKTRLGPSNISLEESASYDFISAEIVKKWSPQNSFKPNSVSYATNRDIVLACSLGHAWTIQPNHHPRIFCDICTKRIKKEKLKLKKQLKKDLAIAQIKQFIISNTSFEIIQEWDDESNGNSFYNFEHHSTFYKAHWVCPVKHKWRQTFKKRWAGAQCYYCSGRKALAGYNDLQTLYPLVAAQWHPTKNGKLKPWHKTPGSNKKVWWLCSHGHEWDARISHRTSKDRESGCPECKSSSTSKPEKKFRRAAQLLFKDVSSSYKNKIILPSFPKGKQIDILGTYNGISFVIEYDGEYWHGANAPRQEVLQNDFLSTRELLDLGFFVIRIREGELYHLAIQDDNLLQISFKRSLEETQIINCLKQTVLWLDQKKF